MSTITLNADTLTFEGFKASLTTLIKAAATDPDCMGLPLDIRCIDGTDFSIPRNDDDYYAIYLHVTGDSHPIDDAYLDVYVNRKGSAVYADYTLNFTTSEALDKERKKKIGKLADVLKAFSEGKKLQWKDEGMVDWCSLTSALTIFSIDTEYRIVDDEEHTAPVVPYSTREEVLVNAIKHGNWVMDKDGDMFQIEGLLPHAVYISQYEAKTFTELSELFVWADDKSPCGTMR